MWSVLRFSKSYADSWAQTVFDVEQVLYESKLPVKNVVLKIYVYIHGKRNNYCACAHRSGRNFENLLKICISVSRYSYKQKTKTVVPIKLHPAEKFHVATHSSET